MPIRSISIKEIEKQKLDDKFISIITMEGIQIPNIENIALLLSEQTKCNVYCFHYSGVKTSVLYRPTEWTLWERIKFVFTNKQ
jgi:hypothetical protein